MANHFYKSQESNFEITSKRRKGFPSETKVKRGIRTVHGHKLLTEKLGRNAFYFNNAITSWGVATSGQVSHVYV